MRPDAPKTPKYVGQTIKMTLSFSPEMKARIKKESKKMFGERKGAESLYVEQAMRIFLKMNIEGVNET